MKSCLDSLGVLCNPLTHFLFRESSAYSVNVLDTVPVDYPATPETHALEEVETPYDVVALCHVVACRHAKLCDYDFFVSYFLKELNHSRRKSKERFHKNIETYKIELLAELNGKVCSNQEGWSKISVTLCRKLMLFNYG